MKKVLAISLVLVSLLLLTSAAMADRGDRVRNHECCPEEEVCPPEEEEVCPPIVIGFPEIPCPEIEVELPEAPCIPEVMIEEFPEICCPEITVEFPEICPPCPPAPAPAPCPEEEHCCPRDHVDHHR